MVNTINIQAKPLSADENSNTKSQIKVKSQSRVKKDFKYQCELCKESFRRKDSLDRHIFQHTGEKSFVCDILGCEKKYSNNSHLNRHKKTSHSDGLLETFRIKTFQFECELCTNKFRQKILLKKHKIIEHNTEDYPIKCSSCQKGFFNKKSLERHAKIHEFVQCTECSETLPNWSRLVIHRRRFHKPHPIFTCDNCDKKFTRRPNLREHMKLHLMSSVVYQCHYESCSKFYTAKRNLFSHIRSKHEGKRWICDYCGLEKTTKQKLAQHMMCHVDPEQTPKIAPFILKLIPQSFQN